MTTPLIVASETTSAADLNPASALRQLSRQALESSLSAGEDIVEVALNLVFAAFDDGFDAGHALGYQQSVDFGAPGHPGYNPYA